MIDSLSYTGNGLDRAATLRRDSVWLATRLVADDTRVMPIWRGNNLVFAGNVPAPAILCGDAARRVGDAATMVAFLGLAESVAVFAADLSAMDEAAAVEIAGGGEFIDIRSIGWLLPHRDAGVMAYARGIAYWHRMHGFCGLCGAPTVSDHAGHMRRCTDGACGRQSFPRTDPAVIMLVTRDDGAVPQCLLGRHARWPGGMYSTLAGFVEPGESLEEAVIREVHEESAIVCSEVRYLASQPWPFPASLMLGFHARAETTEITVATDELEDVRWFSAEEIAGFGEWGETAEGEPRLPRRDSIARWLIEQWLDELR